MLEGFSIVFLSILFEAIPFIIIGSVVSSLIEVFVTPAWITSIIPKRKWLAYLVASLVGFIFPVCECAIVPIVRRLIKKGMPVGLSMTFMLAVPIINPVVLLSTSYAFNNISTAITRGVLGFIAAVSIGLIFDRYAGKKVLLDTNQSNYSCSCGHDHDHEHEHDHNHDHEHDHSSEHDHDNACGHDHEHNNHDHEHEHSSEHDYDNACGHEHSSEHDHDNACGHDHEHDHTNTHGLMQRLAHVISHTSSELFEVGRYLILGAFISALLQTLVPRSALLAFGGHPILSILFMMLLAFVLSLCSEADAFIATTFRYQFSSGSILAFLIFGPMIDIKNTIMLLASFKKAFVFKLMASIFIICLLIALAYNFIFQGVLL